MARQCQAERGWVGSEWGWRREQVERQEGNEHTHLSDINVGLGCDEHCQSLSVVVDSGSPKGSLAILAAHHRQISHLVTYGRRKHAASGRDY